jgi:hypothetical protein
MNAISAPIFRLFEARTLTAILLILVCLPVIWRGLQITRFALAERGHPGDAEAFAPFLVVPGLAFAARQDAYSGDLKGNDADGAEKRAEELTGLLSVAPLSSAYWLILSGMRQVARQPMEMVTDALAMSRLTGSNEGYVQAQRGIFALAMWEGLNAEARTGAIRDMSAAWQGMSADKRAQIGAILAGKSQTAKEEIGKRFLALSRLSTDDLSKLGLKSDELR